MRTPKNTKKTRNERSYRRIDTKRLGLERPLKVGKGKAQKGMPVPPKGTGEKVLWRPSAEPTGGVADDFNLKLPVPEEAVPEWLKEAFSASRNFDTVWKRGSFRDPPSGQTKGNPFLISSAQGSRQWHPAPWTTTAKTRIHGRSENADSGTPSPAIVEIQGEAESSKSKHAGVEDAAPAPRAVAPWGPSFGLTPPGPLERTKRQHTAKKRRREDPLNPWFLTGGIPDLSQSSSTVAPLLLSPIRTKHKRTQLQETSGHNPSERNPYAISQPFLDITSKDFCGRSERAVAAAQRVKDLQAVVESGPKALLEELRKEKVKCRRFSDTLENALVPK